MTSDTPVYHKFSADKKNSKKSRRANLYSYATWLGVIAAFGGIVFLYVSSTKDLEVLQEVHTQLSQSNDELTQQLTAAKTKADSLTTSEQQCKKSLQDKEVEKTKLMEEKTALGQQHATALKQSEDKLAAANKAFEDLKTMKTADDAKLKQMEEQLAIATKALESEKSICAANMEELKKKLSLLESQADAQNKPAEIRKESLGAGAKNEGAAAVVPAPAPAGAGAAPVMPAIH